jgi:FkbM family methyltransferase
VGRPLCLDAGNRTAVEAAAAAGARPVWAGDSILARVLGKYPMYLSPDDESLTPHLATAGMWEAWVTMAVGRLVKPGMRCVDVGANVGYFTVFMADLSEDGGVDAFEPNPAVRHLLRKNARVNGIRASVHGEAVGDSMGEAILEVPKSDFASASTTSRNRSQDPERIPCGVTTLDGLLEPPFHFIKIDAEGDDYKAIRGASRLLAASPDVTVLYEHAGLLFASCYDEGGGSDPRSGEAARLAEVCGMGFRLHRVGYDGSVVAIRPEEVLAEPARVWNLLLMRR